MWVWRCILGVLTIAVLLTIALFLTVEFDANSTVLAAPQCDPKIYYGVEHCIDENGQTHVIFVDLKDSHVRVQTVFPLRPGAAPGGPDSECDSVNGINKDKPPDTLGSNCPAEYPFERVTDMLERYVAWGKVNPKGCCAVAIINTDYFGCPSRFGPCGSSTGDHGAQGLAVRNGIRLDGPQHGVENNYACTAPSLAISYLNNTATIGRPDCTFKEQAEVIDKNAKGKYFNTVGGTPLIVSGGEVNPDPCSATYNYAGDRCSDESQSAAGFTKDGRLVLVTALKRRVTGQKTSPAEELAKYLTTTHQVYAAIKFDGGGSAHLAWLDGAGQIQDWGPKGNRPVAEGLLIFSNLIGDTNNDNILNSVDYNLLRDCYSDLLPAVSCNDEKKRDADLNDDGNVNQFDYNIMLRAFCNLPGNSVACPVEE